MPRRISPRSRAVRLSSSSTTISSTRRSATRSSRLFAKGVRYIADIMGSGLCLNAAPRFNSQKTIVLSAVNTAPSLTKEGGRYFFRVIPSDGVAARQIVEWVVSLNKMTAFVVYGKTDWGEQLHSVFDEAFVERGGKVLVEEAVSDDQILFGPLAQRMSEYPDAALFLAVAPNQAGLIVKEARKLGLRNLIFGTDNFTGQEIVTTGSVALDGVRYVAPGRFGRNERTARPIRRAIPSSVRDRGATDLLGGHVRRGSHPLSGGAEGRRGHGEGDLIARTPSV
ncbi:MAG: ABC transporter substrate-binding protein [Holophagales bacterium]|nr:ABC transporter substrate-binding protein [Holophagales bacterium]